jgi:hypothetical protein
MEEMSVVSDEAMNQFHDNKLTASQVLSQTLANLHQVRTYLNVLVRAHKLQRDQEQFTCLKKVDFSSSNTAVHKDSEQSLEADLLKSEIKTWKTKYEKSLVLLKQQEVLSTKLSAELKECKQELEVCKAKLSKSSANSVLSTLSTDVTESEFVVASERDQLRRAIQRIPEIVEQHVTASYMPSVLYETKRDELRHAHLHFINSKAKEDATMQMHHHRRLRFDDTELADNNSTNNVYKSISGAFQKQMEDLNAKIDWLQDTLHIEREKGEEMLKSLQDAEMTNHKLLDTIHALRTKQELIKRL